MSPLLTSVDAKLQPYPSSEYREEIMFSANDAARYGFAGSEYAILSVQHHIPDVPAKEFAVRLLTASEEVRPNCLLTNSAFYDSQRFAAMQQWQLRPIGQCLRIKSLALEPSMEQERLKEDIRRMRRSPFLRRCLYASPKDVTSNLKFYVTGQAYFNVHDIDPGPTNLTAPAVLFIDENTDLNLFVPHRKGAVDMVIVVDGSESMDLRDYEEGPARVCRRINGAQRALETLITRRLHSGSRVSRFALVAFGKDAKLIYPRDQEIMVELTSDTAEQMRREIINFTSRIDRHGSNVAEALNLASELLYKNADEENEKVIVLLSDGAQWSAQEENSFQVKIQVAREDAVLFADNLYDEGEIRIHTVAISNEDNLRRYERHAFFQDMNRPEGKRVWTPNPKMLNEIARRTQAKFFPSPDARVLKKLFDELGQGTLFPLT